MNWLKYAAVAVVSGVVAVWAVLLWIAHEWFKGR